MNIDSINGKDPELSIALAGALKILQKSLSDPFFKVIYFY
jgi:hypothetical protein